MKNIHVSWKLFVVSLVLTMAFGSLVTVALLSSSVSAYASPAAVDLGNAGGFAALSTTGITNDGTHLTDITGDIGASGITAASMDGVFCSEITGTIYGDDEAYTGNGDTTCFSGTSTLVANAVGDQLAAYNDAIGRAVQDTRAAASADLGGLTLAPGVYGFSGPGDVVITSNLYLDGSATDRWIFIIPGTLDISSSVSVILLGDAKAENIVWAVAGTTQLQTNSVFEGNIISGPATSTINLRTGATLHGRALGGTDVTLQGAVISLAAAVQTNSTTINVTKIVINDDNGTMVAGDFTLYLNESQVISGIANEIDPGQYLVSELAVIGYTGAIGGDCASNGSVTLLFGEHKACTITNDDIPQILDETNVSTSVNISIAPWYPQENNYIFYCNAQGFMPTSYDWNFGDGQHLLDYTQDNIYHSYAEGSYNVTCVAKDGIVSEMGMLSIGLAQDTNGTNETNATENNDTACFTRLTDIPATCNGGSITQNTDLDTYDNCRHITCENETNALSITACEKPDEINPEYFEMYLADRTGTGIAICLGDACISENGFDAQVFPVCIENNTPDIPPVVIPPDTNGTNITCFSQVADLPVFCTGGAVTIDDESGTCRTIVCENGGDIMQILACEKPDVGAKTSFEMYKQWQTGTSVTEICLGDTCIGENGFASQEFPVCIETSPENNTGEMNVTIGIAQWFPQGSNYVFICNAQGFMPTSYDWKFGDGHQLLDYVQNNIYHSYANGTYNVTCTAKNGEVSESGIIEITVGTETNQTSTPMSTIIGLYNASTARGVPDVVHAKIGNGSWSADGVNKFEHYLLPEQLFGSKVKISDIQSISYNTYKDTEQAGNTFYLQIYTDTANCTSPSAGWYCSRLTFDPLYSASLNESIGTWTEWNTDSGVNQLTIYDQPRSGLYGWYYPPTLQQIQAGNISWQEHYIGANDVTRDYRYEEIKYLSFQIGSAWADGFNGSLDNFIVTLNNGTIAIIDFEPMP